MILLDGNFHHKRRKMVVNTIVNSIPRSCWRKSTWAAAKQCLMVPTNSFSSQRISNPETMSLSIENEALSPLGSDLKCDGYGIFLVVSSVLFALYLALHAKKNLKSLCRRGSYVVVSYYALLWLVTLLNLAWSSLQVHHIASFLFCIYFFVFCFDDADLRSLCDLHYQLVKNHDTLDFKTSIFRIKTIIILCLMIKMVISISIFLWVSLLNTRLLWPPFQFVVFFFYLFIIIFYFIEFVVECVLEHTAVSAMRIYEGKGEGISTY